ncbi:MAG: hypothetical protein JO072_07225 [Parafilimonas sp.]|nr:hypothetical protein [Parafilimonas sp.]
MFRITLLTFIVFLSASTNAQSFLYSTPVSNDPNIQTDIIGKVENNIVVWRHSSLIKHAKKLSEFLIYDDNMKLINKSSYDFIRPHEIVSTNFINEGNTFAFVIQYLENDFHICKLISFDANGNLLNNQLLERVRKDEDDEYVVKRSPGNEAFALLKIIPSNINGTIALVYYFIKNDVIVHSDKILLPFNIATSGLGQTFLDDNSLLIPLQDSIKNGSRLSLYKINLNNNSSINVLRDLSDGQLMLESLAINGNNNRYIITSEWKTNEPDTSNYNRIFVWQLNKDLFDISTDTLIENIGAVIPCLSNIHYYSLNNIANNISSNIIIRASDINVGINGNYFPVSPGDNISSATMGGFYEGRILSTTPKKNLNGNSYYAESNIAHGETWDGSNPPLKKGKEVNNQPDKMLPQIATFAVLNIDIRNHLQWSQCFSASDDKFQLVVNNYIY